MKRNTRSKAFTLVELLTVIAIIAILAGLLFPTIKTAMIKTEKAKAQTAIAGLAIAFKSYYNEYGKWPIAYLGVPPVNYKDFIVDKTIVALLSGDDVGGTSVTYPAPGPYSATIDTPPGGPPYSSALAATVQGNPRKIVFLEFKKADIDSSSISPTYGYFLDPWRRPYHFRLDVNYQNQIDYPFTSAGKPLPGVGFLIWSLGPDGQYGLGDTVVGTPPPLVVNLQDPLNKDNVVSW